MYVFEIRAALKKRQRNGKHLGRRMRKNRWERG